MTPGGGWGNRQPAGLWSLAVSVRVRVPQPPSTVRQTARRGKVSVPDSSIAVLVLATGDDDFMGSRSRAKVLHAFAGRTLLDHVLAAVAPLKARTTVVLVGERGDQV